MGYAAIKNTDDPRAVRMPKYTGIIEIDANKLILKPNLVPWKLSYRILVVITLSLILGSGLALVGWWFRLQISPYPLIGLWLVQIAGSAAAMFLEETIVVLKDRGDVVRERRFLLVPWKSRKSLWQLSAINAVILRERVDAGAIFGPLTLAPIPKDLYWIHVSIDGNHKLFWYTKYRDAAVAIAQTIAKFSGAPLEDPSGLSADCLADKD